MIPGISGGRAAALGSPLGGLIDICSGYAGLGDSQSSSISGPASRLGGLIDTSGESLAGPDGTMAGLLRPKLGGAPSLLPWLERLGFSNGRPALRRVLPPPHAVFPGSRRVASLPRPPSHAATRLGFMSPPSPHAGFGFWLQLPPVLATTGMRSPSPPLALPGLAVRPPLRLPPGGALRGLNGGCGGGSPTGRAATAWKGWTSVISTASGASSLPVMNALDCSRKRGLILALPRNPADEPPNSLSCFTMTLSSRMRTSPSAVTSAMVRMPILSAWRLYSDRNSLKVSASWLVCGGRGGGAVLRQTGGTESDQEGGRERRSREGSRREVEKDGGCSTAADLVGEPQGD